MCTTAPAQQTNRLKLPCGMGVQLRDAMTQLVEDLHSAIRTAFESDKYHAGRQVIEQEAMERREAVMEQVREEAKAEDSVVALPDRLCLRAGAQWRDDREPDESSINCHGAARPL